MENFIVWLVVIGAVAYTIKGLVKTWKGQSGCHCSSNCTGCAGNHGSCDQVIK